jgi:DNA invertase Pin-like site-specific DNA recombinase
VKEEKMKKVLEVVYCRVSSKKQKDMGLSLDGQEDYIRSFCDGNYDLVKVFKFQESASKDERKHLWETFKYCLENGIKLIFISEVDRWARNRNMDMEARKYLKKHGLSVFLIDARQSIPEFNSEDDELSHNLKVDVADHLAAKIRKKVLIGLEQKLKRNEYPGLPPIGYRAIPKTRGGKPPQIIQTDDAPLMKKFLEIFSTGKFSVHQAVRLAQDIGLKPKTKDRFSKGQLGKLIKSCFYYGEFVWSHPWIDDGEQKIYENKTDGFEPIISKKTWEKNQEILKSRRKNFQTEKLSFKFNNLITCGKCGRKVYGARFDHQISWETKDGQKVKKYRYDPYYLCTKGPLIENGEVVEGKYCDTPSFKEKEIEKMLMDEISLIKFNTEHWAKVKEDLFKDETKDFIISEIKMLRSEQTKNENALDKMYDDYCKEIINADFFKSRSEKIRERQQEIKDRLSELEEEREHFDKRIGKSIEVLDAMKNWSKILKNASDEKKNHLLRLLTIKISTIHEKVEKNGKIHEHKGLEFTYSPEVQELIQIGILEVLEKLSAPVSRPDDLSLIVRNLSMSAAALRI